MSDFTTDKLACPRCSNEVELSTAESINVTRMPSARDKILAGTFHRFACSSCQERITVDRVFLYTDMRREQFVHIFPVDHSGDWPRWEEIAAQTFWEAFNPAPPAMREIATRYRVRAVFGLAALADKVRVWEAGLDDVIVELQKLELATAHEALRTRTDVALDVVAVDDATIEVAATSLSNAWPEERYALARTRYVQLAAARSELVEKFPGLFHKPYVGYRRLANETLVGGDA